MRRLLLLAVLFGVLLSFTGCDEFASSSASSDRVESKVIAAKESPIESRVSAMEIAFGSGSITKSVTVYYLVATDGSITEVDVSTWARTNVGDTYTTSRWEQKE